MKRLRVRYCKLSGCRLSMGICDANYRSRCAAARPAFAEQRCDFSFVPTVLIEYYKPFIISYHKLSGFSFLPDILWHPEIRKFIEADLTLRELFKKSSSSRSAKRANEGFVMIAALILSAEILAVGLAGWARRYPAAHKKAKTLFAEYAPNSRARLTERYVYPRISDLLKADLQKQFSPVLREDISGPCGDQGDSQRRTPI
jgi:hypothetical protein